MEKHNRHQNINCNVVSCQYYEKQNHCSLEEIQVSPCGHVHNGVAEDESMCASYKKRI